MKRQPLFICCLYNVALSMLDELAFMKGNSFQYQLLTNSCFGNICSKLLAYQVV